MRTTLFLVSIAWSGLTACSGRGVSWFQAPAPDPFQVVINVESDPGRPVPDAVVMRGGTEGPHTGPDGRATLKLGGKEGEAVDLSIRCPKGYAPSSKPLTVSLRRIVEAKLAEYTARCEPTVRSLVVVVRANDGPNLPVMYFGRMLGRTDGSGAFTTKFELKPGDAVELVLDTSDPAFERIHPKMPTGSFVVQPYDDVVTYNQPFKWDALPHKHHAPKPRLPVLIAPRNGAGEATVQATTPTIASVD